ncbi:MAG: hypothetical protein ACAH07_05935 [Methylophilaceae bacterium]|nr:hypothetical protein [Methyloradius sp.]
MASTAIKIEFDASESLAMLDSLFPHLADRSSESRQAFIGRFNALVEPFCVVVDGGAAVRAGTIRLTLELSDGLLDLMAAFRAGDFDSV